MDLRFEDILNGGQRGFLRKERNVFGGKLEADCVEREVKKCRNAQIHIVCSIKDERFGELVADPMRRNDEDLLRKRVAAANVGEVCKDGIHGILVEVTSHNALERSGCRADPESTSMVLAFILILGKSSMFDLCCNIPQEFT